MANNRMYLRCKGCGEELCLGKTFDDGWFFVSSNEEKGRQLSDFLENHSFCAIEKDTQEYEPFELVYESQSDYWNKHMVGEHDKI